MADIQPFRALRYDLSKAGEIQDLTSPPYDIVSEEQRQDYLQRNPHNIIRLELPKGQEPYREAQKTLEAWLESGVLKNDMDPGLYLYEMEFLSQVDQGEVKKLRGLIAQVRLEEFSAGVVLPHEETLSKAKEDRFQLMRATHCNFSQIYCLYQDEAQTTRRRMDNLASGCAPRYDFSDGLVTHRLWVVNDPEAIAAIQEDFAPRKLYIADGHHRYETALNFQRHLEESGAFCPGADYVMMFLAAMDDPGLVVFPTHRLVRGLAQFDGEALLRACASSFEVEALEGGPDSAQAALNAAYDQGRHAFAYFDGVRWALLTLRQGEDLSSPLPEKSAAYRGLDVTILHTLVLERLLGIDKENMANQVNLTYTRSAGEAEASVASGESQCCFLLNPTRVEEIGAVAQAGEKMPQKSTYFYPKLLTGLVMRRGAPAGNAAGSGKASPQRGTPAGDIAGSGKASPH